MLKKHFLLFTTALFFLLLHVPLKYREEFKSHYSVLLIKQNSESLFLSFCLLNVKDFQEKPYFHFLANA